MKSIAPFLVMIAILITTAVLVIALFNYLLRKRILDSRPLDESALRYLRSLSGFTGSEALKWGIILFFGGLGLVVLQFVPFAAADSPLPYGVEAIFVALGFLVYYYILRKNKKPE